MTRLPFSVPAMRWGALTILALFAVHALAGCAPASAVPPAELRAPDARLTEPPRPLPALAPLASGNTAMIEAYGQCRVAHADEADRRSGLVAYVAALRGK